MNDREFFLSVFSFFMGFLLVILLCITIGPPNGTKNKPVKLVPINCVVDYERDGIHYCILENK